MTIVFRNDILRPNINFIILNELFGPLGLLYIVFRQNITIFETIKYK